MTVQTTIKSVELASAPILHTLQSNAVAANIKALQKSSDIIIMEWSWWLRYRVIYAPHEHAEQGFVGSEEIPLWSDSLDRLLFLDRCITGHRRNGSREHEMRYKDAASRLANKST